MGLLYMCTYVTVCVGMHMCFICVCFICTRMGVCMKHRMSVHMNRCACISVSVHVCVYTLVYERMPVHKCMYTSWHMYINAYCTIAVAALLYCTLQQEDPEMNSE